MAAYASPSHSLLARPGSQNRARARRHMESISSSPVTALAGPLSSSSERQTQKSLVPAWAPAAELALRNSQLRRCGYASRSGDVAGRRRRCAARASVATGTGAGEAEGQPSAPFLTRVADFQHAFWKFLRPHTIRGTVLGTSAVVAKALIENPHAINWALTPRALLGLLALLCGNGYIVGINQIYDTDIDKVNKPFLPVASGELSPALASLLCAGLSIAGVGIVAANFGTLITALYCLGLLLGTLYSVPPFRLKRFALPAFLIIATVRGLLLNFGVYYATRAALALPFAWSPSILFITCFVTVFATVIAITKDLPDVEGDRKFKIETFATRLGVRAIAFAGAGLLLMNYFGAIVAAVRLPTAFRGPLMISSHALLALALVFQTWKLDAAKYTQESIAAFYRFIWNLFYLEYCLLPFL